MSDDLDEDWNRPRPGRGRSMRPLPGRGLSRTRFELREGAGLLSVDVDHDESRAALFRDGVEIARGEMPVRFAVEAGGIEVNAGMHGMTRIHLVRPDGTQERLEPAVGAPEYRRAMFGRRHPRLSRALGIAAIAVLVVDLALFAPQLLEIVTRLDVWPFGVFTSPIELPGPLNVALLIAGALAATERALTFRHNKLLDIETEWFES